MASELEVGKVVVGDSTNNHAWVTTKSTPGYYSGIKLTRGAGTFADANNNNFGLIVSDIGLSAAKFTSPGADVTGRTDFLTIDANGNVMVGTPDAGSAAAMFHISGAAPRIRLEDTSAPANYSQIGADNGQLTLAADGGGGQGSSAIIAQVDGTTRLTIDSSGQVGVNNSAPSAPLEVSSSAASTSSVISTFSTTDSEHSVLALKKSSSATVGTKAVTADGEILGRIDAYGVDTNSNQRRGAQIEFNQAAAATGSKVAGNIVFKTSSTSANDVEAMRIDSTGQLTIPNTSDPTLKIHNTTGGTNDTAAVVFGVSSGTADGPRIESKRQSDGTIDFNLYTAGATSQTNAAAAMVIDGGSNLVSFGGGINLGDTTLSNYAEGTWTPVVEGGTSAGTYTSAFSNANYTRVGRMVTVNYNLAWNSHTGTGDLIITGLPFTVLTNTAVIGAFQCNSGLSWTAGYLPAAYGYTTKIQFRATDDGGGSHQLVQIAATVNYLRGTLTYFI